MQAQGMSAAELDGYYEQLVLWHVLREQPTILRLCDLVRELAKAPDDFGHRDGVERAVVELVKVGLLYREGKLVLPTPAAVYVQEMDLG